MKKIIILLLTLTLVFTMTACSGDTGESIDGQLESDDTVNEDQASIPEPDTISIDYDSDDEDFSDRSDGMSFIELKGDSITLNGDGAIVEGNTVTIISAGTFSITGTLDDGQIIVNTEEKETVKLVLNGMDITCSNSAPIYISDAKKTVITLAEGTDNNITDGDSYILEDTESDKPNAAVFSKGDLTINGKGSLTVNANYNNGIQSKDELKILGSSVTVNSVNDGIKGRDFVAIRNGNIILNAGGDGMQSNNDEDSDKGYIYLEDSIIDITAGEDGIQAETSLVVSSGHITISSGGGSINSSNKENWGDWGRRIVEDNMTDSSTVSRSAKGLKTDAYVMILNGTIDIDSSDDSIHSNYGLIIKDGDITLSSGDDGIHSDSTLEINGGDINITKSYEGIESEVITINNGNIHIVSSDDGINVVGGNDGSSINGRPGQNTFVNSGNNHLYINGGYIFVNATGDGLDINGPIDMTDGTVIINGPTADNNGALDYSGSFKITGGFLVAVGSSGMAQAPSTSSTQYSLMLNLESSQPANTMVCIETEGGEEILTFVPEKSYKSIVLCSPEMKNGSTYAVYTGGSSTGNAVDGLISEGTYIAGTQVTSFTVSNIVTSIGSSGGIFGGRRR